MKKFKFLAFLLGALCLAPLTSCSDDDDDPNSWITESEGTYSGKYEVVALDEDGDVIMIASETIEGVKVNFDEKLQTIVFDFGDNEKFDTSRAEKVGNGYAFNLDIVEFEGMTMQGHTYAETFNEVDGETGKKFHGAYFSGAKRLIFAAEILMSEDEELQDLIDAGYTVYIGFDLNKK